MKIDSLQPSLLNFLSGVTSSVAITFLTTLGVNGIHAPQLKLLYDSVPWAGVAGVLAWLASMIDDVRRETAILESRDLSKEERIELYKSKIDQIRPRARKLIALIIALAVLGVSILVLL